MDDARDPSPPGPPGPPGWKITIHVPHPYGRDRPQVWLAAIPDAQTTREKLMLPEIPGEADLVPLSPDEVAEFALEPGEIRRLP